MSFWTPTKFTHELTSKDRFYIVAQGTLSLLSFLALQAGVTKYIKGKNANDIQDNPYMTYNSFDLVFGIPAAILMGFSKKHQDLCSNMTLFFFNMMAFVGIIMSLSIVYVMNDKFAGFILVLSTLLHILFIIDLAEDYRKFKRAFIERMNKPSMSTQALASYHAPGIYNA
jgi:hypothetical protein